MVMGWDVLVHVLIYTHKRLNSEPLYGKMIRKKKNYRTKTKRQNNIMIGKRVAKRNNYAFK